MRRSIRRLLMAVYLGAFITGCATTSKLSHEQVMQEYSKIAQLEQSVKTAQAQGVDYLAPDGYRTALAELNESVNAAANNRSAAANSAATMGSEALIRANRDAEISRDTLREVLEARERAIRAGAPQISASKYASLEEELRKATNLIEKGQFEDAKRRRPKLIDGYAQLELASLKEGTVEAAKASIAHAREDDAHEYAPKTFRAAEEELALTLSILDADRTQTAKADIHAKRTKWLAEKSAAITEIIKDFDRRDFSNEDIVLWYQKQLSMVNQPLGNELPFNQPNRNVVLSIQQAIDAMNKREALAQEQISQLESQLHLSTSQLQAQTATTQEELAQARQQFEHELALSAQQRLDAARSVEEKRQRFENVQSLFDSAEANVFQQRQNVLISAHGFRFPPGKSEIESENFSLLNKVVKAIRTFPDGNVEVSGHTDSTGEAELNQALSQQRAEKVVKFLNTVGGIPLDRLSSHGYGETRPVASNETQDGRAANRRVEVLIINQ